MALVIGIAGGGTVGGGVVTLLQTRVAPLGIDVRIKILCVRDVSRKRDFDVPAGVKVVSDYHEILADDEINCVVEVMGGTTDAKDLIFSAISKGKHIITANKALIAKFLPDLQEKLKENPSVCFGYEAAVCGGIPIIHTLQRDFASDRIDRIAGIMNGTTNFILSKMGNEKSDYLPVLKEAQLLGYAEADPAADVEGWDARSKLCLLTKLAFGVFVPEEKIHCLGISTISGEDFEYAKLLKSTIKILGVAYRSGEEKKKLSLFVSPVIVPEESILAGTGGVTNIVQVNSDNLKASWFVGPGAGRFATANSVVSDIILLAKNQLSPPFPRENLSEGIEVEPNFEGRFFLRFTISDGLGIIRKTGELCEKNGVSIHSVLQTPIKDHDRVVFAVTTEYTHLSNVKAVCQAMEQESFSRGPALCIPILVD